MTIELSAVWVTFCIKLYKIIHAKLAQISSQTKEKYDKSVCFSPCYHSILLKTGASLIAPRAWINYQTAILIVKRGFSRKLS